MAEPADRRTSVGSFQSRRNSVESFERRNSVESFKSNRNSVESLKSRRTSVESIKINLIDNTQQQQCSLTKQEQNTVDQNAEPQTNEGETQNLYVQSKFSRKGSIQYRNAGWKSSLMRNDSSSSIKSNASGKQIEVISERQPNIPVRQLTPEEQKVYFQQKFLDIAAILKDTGVEEDILQELRNVD